jgi:hypothetical protein
MPSRPMPSSSPDIARPQRIYLDHSAHRLFSFLEHGRSGQAYNVSTDEVISIASLAYLVRDVLPYRKPF